MKIEPLFFFFFLWGLATWLQEEEEGGCGEVEGGGLYQKERSE